MKYLFVKYLLVEISSRKISLPPHLNPRRRHAVVVIVARQPVLGDLLENRHERGDNVLVRRRVGAAQVDEERQCGALRVGERGERGERGEKDGRREAGRGA